MVNALLKGVLLGFSGVAMATINDLVLVHVDNRPGFFARIDDISPDVKPGWWCVRLLVLTFPLQVYTWILDSSQIDGEPFTMGGTPMLLEKVISPEPHPDTHSSPLPENETTAAGEGVAQLQSPAKVISLTERKKK
jgi:hypothetical protein